MRQHVLSTDPYTLNKIDKRLNLEAGECKSLALPLPLTQLKDLGLIGQTIIVGVRPRQRKHNGTTSFTQRNITVDVRRGDRSLVLSYGMDSLHGNTRSQWPAFTAFLGWQQEEDDGVNQPPRPLLRVGGDGTDTRRVGDAAAAVGVEAGSDGAAAKPSTPCEGTILPGMKAGYDRDGGQRGDAGSEIKIEARGNEPAAQPSTPHEGTALPETDDGHDRKTKDGNDPPRLPHVRSSEQSHEMQKVLQTLAEGIELKESRLAALEKRVVELGDDINTVRKEIEEAKDLLKALTERL